MINSYFRLTKTSFVLLALAPGITAAQSFLEGATTYVNLEGGFSFASGTNLTLIPSLSTSGIDSNLEADLQVPHNGAAMYGGVLGVEFASGLMLELEGSSRNADIPSGDLSLALGDVSDSKDYSAEGDFSETAILFNVGFRPNFLGGRGFSPFIALGAGFAEQDYEINLAAIENISNPVNSNTLLNKVSFADEGPMVQGKVGIDIPFSSNMAGILAYRYRWMSLDNVPVTMTTAGDKLVFDADSGASLISAGLRFNF